MFSKKRTKPIEKVITYIELIHVTILEAVAVVRIVG